MWTQRVPASGTAHSACNATGRIARLIRRQNTCLCCRGNCCPQKSHGGRCGRCVHGVGRWVLRPSWQWRCELHKSRSRRSDLYKRGRGRSDVRVWGTDCPRCGTGSEWVPVRGLPGGLRGHCNQGLLSHRWNRGGDRPRTCAPIWHRDSPISSHPSPSHMPHYSDCAHRMSGCPSQMPRIGGCQLPERMGFTTRRRRAGSIVGLTTRGRLRCEVHRRNEGFPVGAL